MDSQTASADFFQNYIVIRIKLSYKFSERSNQNKFIPTQNLHEYLYHLFRRIHGETRHI